ncbi:MAG TPA: protein-L-isoaspartate(D-aspartate) O-methyltransferase [Candidatus Sulfotelmatobacter sp.]|nr:protein-L-isoaspartate(D-aspartate) O-methyltransferase [Candidatus Sulfotelmatobacter sp.]
MSAPLPASAEAGWFATLRQRMVDHDLRGRGIADERVLGAMLRVPRHEFVPEAYRGQAYEDHPLPIGEGQTISQPYIVAIMLETLALQLTDTVLEVGTGSGYATALLAELVSRVVSVERYPTLAAGARQLLSGLGYRNVNVVLGDGSEGFPAGAPYDAILVSAATAAVPPALLAQLREEGGRLIIPVGPAESQLLQLIRMVADRVVVTSCGACRFVPLVSGTGV